MKPINVKVEKDLMRQTVPDVFGKGVLRDALTLIKARTVHDFILCAIAIKKDIKGTVFLMQVYGLLLKGDKLLTRHSCSVLVYCRIVLFSFSVPPSNHLMLHFSTPNDSTKTAIVPSQR